MFDEATRGKTPHTVGMSIAIDECCYLFMKIMDNLKDREESVASMNSNARVLAAIIHAPKIRAMKQAGII